MRLFPKDISGNQTNPNVEAVSQWRMNLRLYFLFATVALIQMAAAATTREGFPSIINRVNAIAYEKNAEKGLALLEELQSLEIWGIGANGPADKTTLTMLALVAFDTFLPWNKKTASQIGTDQSSRIQNWMRADVGQEAAMLAMLSSQDPIARWMATQKLESVGSMSPGILSQIRHLAVQDDYFQIGRGVLVGPNVRSDITDEYGIIFQAPLRTQAVKLLNMAKVEDIRIDQRKLSIEGLAWLGRLYAARVNDRLTIFRILRILSPISPEIVEAKRRAENAQSSEDQAILFQYLIDVSSARMQHAGSLVEGEPLESRSVHAPQIPDNTVRPAKQLSLARQPGIGSKWPLLACAIVILILSFAAIYVVTRK